MRAAALLLLSLPACPMQVDDPGASARGPAPSPAAQAPEGSAPPAAPAEAPAVDEGAPAGASTAAGPPPLVSDAVPIRIDVQPPREGDPEHTQERLRAGDHVTFSGAVRCEACVAPLVLRVLPFQPPDQIQLGSAPDPLTVLPLAGPGAFTLAVPRGTEPVVLELLVDLDANGKPDRGERMAVVVRDGQLVPDQDRQGFVIDATESESGPWPAMGPEQASEGAGAPRGP